MAIGELQWDVSPDNDVIQAAGTAEDVAIAEIIGADATIEGLAATKAWIANDTPLMNDGRPTGPGVVS